MDANQQTDCIFLDFSKAFDRVAHCRLISKLSALKLDSLSLSWIRNFLSLRQQFTVVNNFSSSRCHVTSGVPQGSVLGPLLFLIYTNDLPRNISSRMRLFADDCIVYRTITNAADHIALQNDLNTISHWCEIWLMSLNLSKCKFVSFSRKRNTSAFKYVLNNFPVSQASSYKYLGVHLTHNLSWSLHITTVCAKASRTLGYLRRNLKHCPTNVRKLAYLTYVRPQLEFASSVWSPYQKYLISMIEAIQNRAARFISQKYSRYFSATQIKIDNSLEPLETRRAVAIVCLLHKYVNCSYLPPLPLEAPVRMSNRLNNQRSFKRIYGHTQAFNLSALPTAVTLWNDLPNTIVSITDHTLFRNQVYRHYLQ